MLLLFKLMCQGLYGSWNFQTRKFFDTKIFYRKSRVFKLEFFFSIKGVLILCLAKKGTRMTVLPRLAIFLFKRTEPALPAWPSIFYRNFGVRPEFSEDFFTLINLELNSRAALRDFLAVDI